MISGQRFDVRQIGTMLCNHFVAFEFTMWSNYVRGHSFHSETPFRRNVGLNINNTLVGEYWWADTSTKIGTAKDNKNFNSHVFLFFWHKNLFYEKFFKTWSIFQFFKLSYFWTKNADSSFLILPKKCHSLCCFVLEVCLAGYFLKNNLFKNVPGLLDELSAKTSVKPERSWRRPF